MKHKSWIKNYERNFEKLAEEIGDLRYDVLSEFLELLGKKIKKDGEKDKNRGRVKLATNLQISADAIIDSSDSIKEAWIICEPYMYPEDVVNKIKSEFKDKNKINEAFKLLSDFYKEYEILYKETNYTFRLARCLLYETNGSIEKLRANAKLANTDYREIIMDAEYDENTNWLRNFNKKFGEEKVTQIDIEDDKNWKSDDDGLPF